MPLLVPIVCHAATITPGWRPWLLLKQVAKIDDLALSEEPDLALALSGFEDALERIEAAALQRWRQAACDAIFWAELAQTTPGPNALLVSASYAAEARGLPLSEVPLVRAVRMELYQVERNEVWPRCRCLSMHVAQESLPKKKAPSEPRSKQWGLAGKAYYEAQLRSAAATLLPTHIAPRSPRGINLSSPPRLLRRVC